MISIIDILIVDDHPIVRDGLLAILNTQSDFRIVGEASSGKEALVLFEPAFDGVILLDKESSLAEGLTARELEVLELLVQGKQNKEIASELFITDRTVKFHISAILGKLDASNRTEAVTTALQLGLVTL